MTSLMSKLWVHIFDTLKYTGDTELIITAKQIKKCKETWTGEENQFEPRNLCYQTSEESRPACFKEKGLYIIPIENGIYLLSKKSMYKDISYDNITPIQINRDTSSSLLSIGGSEISMIDNLRYAGVFERLEILGEPITHGPIMGGRHRITTKFIHGEKEIEVKGVQYETDSAYETKNKILICEGKSENVSKFNIRQLYFPFREVMRVTEGKKEVLCLFIRNCKGVIHIWKYKFSDVNRMDSITLHGHYVYMFNS